MAALYTERDLLYSEAPLDSLVPPPRLSKDDLGYGERDEDDGDNSFVPPMALGFGTSNAASVDDDSAEIFSGIGAKLLKAAGWKEGTGLGKDSQGIVSAIQASEKHDRLGLGFQAPDTGIVKKRHAIDLNQYIDHRQSLADRWISCPLPYSPEYSAAMGSPLLTEPHKPIDYDLFCTKDLVNQLFAAKAQFDPVASLKFIQARKNANPYELIGKSVFLNRAAVKMANMDALVAFKLTSPDDLSDDETFTFCDVCAGPGGFTEYVLWRREGRARGWGFTLREGDNDFQPWKFNRQPVTQFTPYYGVDGTGDVTKNANILSFMRLIEQNTDGKGVALMMADGGFSVEGDENFQEEHLKQLVLCQFSTALAVVRQGGAFVCKVFDLFTPFVVGLVYILYRHFDRVSVFKPYTSRPANSERYIICFGLKQRHPPVLDHLLGVNDKLNELGSWGKDDEPDLLHVVPLSTMLEDEQFVQYIRQQNIAQAREQADALNLLMKYVEDEGLLPLDQSDVRRRCLREWNVPETLEADLSASRRESLASRRDSSGGFRDMYIPSDPSMPMRPSPLRPLQSFSMPLPATPVASALSTASNDEIAYTTREEYIEEQRKRAQKYAMQNSAWRRQSSNVPSPGTPAPISRRSSTTSIAPATDTNGSAAGGASVSRQASMPTAVSTPSALGRRPTVPTPAPGRVTPSLRAPVVDGTRISPHVKLRGQPAADTATPTAGTQSAPSTPVSTASLMRKPTAPTAAALTAKRKASSLADLEAAFMGAGGSKKQKTT